jgi:hypothetical protein
MLMSGQDFAFLDRGLGPEGRLSEELLREVWKLIGDELLDLWLTGYAKDELFPGDGGAEPRPDTRPWGWWKFEATEGAAYDAV